MTGNMTAILNCLSYNINISLNSWECSSLIDNKHRRLDDAHPGRWWWWGSSPSDYTGMLGRRGREQVQVRRRREGRTGNGTAHPTGTAGDRLGAKYAAAVIITSFPPMRPEIYHTLLIDRYSRSITPCRGKSASPANTRQQQRTCAFVVVSLFFWSIQVACGSQLD